MIWLSAKLVVRLSPETLYGLIGLVTLWFCWKFVPETKGRSLPQIDAIFERRARK